MESKAPHKYLALIDTNYVSINSVIDSVGRVKNEQAIRDFFENIDLKYPSRIVVERYTYIIVFSY